MKVDWPHHTPNSAVVRVTHVMHLGVEPGSMLLATPGAVAATEPYRPPASCSYTRVRTSFSKFSLLTIYLQIKIH